METNDISQDIVEQNVWIQIARQATVEPVVASVLGKINVSALVSGQRWVQLNIMNFFLKSQNNIVTMVSLIIFF